MWGPDSESLSVSTSLANSGKGWCDGLKTVTDSLDPSSVHVPLESVVFLDRFG